MDNASVLCQFDPSAQSNTNRLVSLLMISTITFHLTENTHCNLHFVVAHYEGCSFLLVGVNLAALHVPDQHESDVFAVHLGTMLLNVSCYWIVCCLGPCDNHKPPYFSETPCDCECVCGD